MANINKVILIGRLTADPELRRTQSDLPVSSFTVAINRRGKDAGADFIDCVAWRSSAEFLAKYFHKGDPVYVSGSIQVRQFKDKNDNNRKAVEVVADEIQFVADKKKEAAPVADVEEWHCDDSELPY